MAHLYLSHWKQPQPQQQAHDKKLSPPSDRLGWSLRPTKNHPSALLYSSWNSDNDDDSSSSLPPYILPPPSRVVLPQDSMTSLPTLATCQSGDGTAFHDSIKSHSSTGYDDDDDDDDDAVVLPVATTRQESAGIGWDALPPERLQDVLESKQEEQDDDDDKSLDYMGLAKDSVLLASRWNDQDSLHTSLPRFGSPLSAYDRYAFSIVGRDHLYRVNTEPEQEEDTKQSSSSSSKDDDDDDDDLEVFLQTAAKGKDSVDAANEDNNSSNNNDSLGALFATAIAQEATEGTVDRLAGALPAPKPRNLVTHETYSQLRHRSVAAGGSLGEPPKTTIAWIMIQVVSSSSLSSSEDWHANPWDMYENDENEENNNNNGENTTTTLSLFQVPTSTSIRQVKMWIWEKMAWIKPKDKVGATLSRRIGGAATETLQHVDWNQDGRSISHYLKGEQSDPCDLTNDDVLVLQLQLGTAAANQRDLLTPFVVQTLEGRRGRFEV